MLLFAQPLPLLLLLPFVVVTLALAVIFVGAKSAAAVVVVKIVAAFALALFPWPDGFLPLQTGPGRALHIVGASDPAVSRNAMSEWSSLHPSLSSYHPQPIREGLARLDSV